MRSSNKVWVAYWFVLSSGSVLGQEVISVGELTVDGIYATRANDPVTYCLLGANTCLLSGIHNAWTDEPLIKSWIGAHPGAVATPVSTEAWPMARGNGQPERRTYLWISEGSDSLNVALVREGRYEAGLMIDMVDAEQRQNASYDGDTRTQIDRERAKIPEEDRPRRLVTDSAYAAMMRSTSKAEELARQKKRGLWSDEGLKGRAPPRDTYLIAQLKSHRDWFARIRALADEDPRLLNVNRNPTTAKAALDAGVAATKIEEYVDLLNKLNANEETTSVYGLGRLCLITADITYGLFDNGIIKGYVFLPADPRPLAGNLDTWSPREQETTAYRAIEGHWYLFALYH